MILFYSVSCKHCQMLLDSVQRLDAKGMVKKVLVEDLRQTHPKVYSQLQMVPALMLLPSKELLYGKAVFDYLLLPTRGKLVGGAGREEQGMGGGAGAGAGAPLTPGGVGATSVLHMEEGIMAFNTSHSRGFYSDSFADINEVHATPTDPNCPPHSSYQWTSIEEMVLSGSEGGGVGGAAGVGAGAGAAGIGTPSLNGVNMETRNQKEPINLDAVRQQRDRDLQTLYSDQPQPLVS